MDRYGSRNSILDRKYFSLHTTVKLDFSGRQNKRQLDFKRQNENDCFLCSKSPSK